MLQHAQPDYWKITFQLTYIVWFGAFPVDMHFIFCKRDNELSEEVEKLALKELTVLCNFCVGSPLKNLMIKNFFSAQMCIN